MSAEDIFSQFFGGGGGGGRQQQQEKKRKPRDLLVVVEITLEEAFCGATKQVKVFRRRKCHQCKATGFADGKPRKCSTCAGRGVRVVRQAMGNMVMQRQVQCDACGGKGAMRPTGSLKCPVPACVEGVDVNPCTIDVAVEAGSRDGDALRFEGKGHQDPELPEAGDVLVVLEEQPHPHFRRLGEHHVVATNVVVPLMHALEGKPVPLEHLDGAVLMCRPSPAGGVGVTPLSPSYAYIVSRRGFVVKGTGGAERGDLYVPVQLHMPDPKFLAKLTDAQRDVLWQHLAPPGSKRPASPPPRTALSLSPYDHHRKADDATAAGADSPTNKKSTKAAKRAAQQEAAEGQRGNQFAGMGSMPAGGVHMQTAQCPQQ
jgi:DnaJ family protein A protein 2